MRKVFLDELPRWKSGEGTINWKESIGYKVRFIYDDIKGEVEIVNTEGRFLYIKYEDKEIFRITHYAFRDCGIGRLVGKYTDKFRFKIGDVVKNNKKDFIIIDREYRKNNKGQNLKYYKYKCNKCGFDEGWIYEHGLTSDDGGCPCCSGKTLVQGINDIPTTDPWMVKFFQGGYNEAKMYTKSSSTRIYPICPDCGRIKDKTLNIYTIYHYKSIGCTCGDGNSYPNKFMFFMLEQLKINFIPEYSPDWIKPKRYDFYFKLKDNKYIVEMDGGLGHGKNIHNKSNKTIEETKTEDEYKDMMAEEHSIEVIRIDSDKSELEYIKNNIINSKLVELFDLSNIDWLKCEEFALSNRVKKACELKRDNPEMTTKEIGEIMNLSQGTIVIYLKKGTKLGWCDYDSKHENFKGSSKSGKMKGKPVEIFKDGVSLGIFESISELERRSEELFGVKLGHSAISSVCVGKANHYKHFTLKHIS